MFSAEHSWHSHTELWWGSDTSNASKGPNDQGHAQVNWDNHCPWKGFLREIKMQKAQGDVIHVWEFLMGGHERLLSVVPPWQDKRQWAPIKTHSIPSELSYPWGQPSTGPGCPGWLWCLHDNSQTLLGTIPALIPSSPEGPASPKGSDWKLALLPQDSPRSSPTTRTPDCFQNFNLNQIPGLCSI